MKLTPRRKLGPGDDRAAAIARTREMIRIQRRGRRDRWPPVVLGSSYLAFSAVALTQLDSISLVQIAAVVLLLPVYVLGQRLGLEDDDGSFVMTQPVFVAMLFLVPLAAVPAVVLAGAIAGAPRDPTPYHPVYKLLHVAMNGWFCVGPVLVLAAFQEGPASLDQWPVYVAALLAQFLCDGVVGFVCSIASGGRPTAHLGAALWTDAMDVLLAAIGLTAVIATGGSLWAVLFASAPIGVLFLVTRDRQAQLARAVAVTDAFDEVIVQTMVDPLTGLANRRRWDEAVVDAEGQRATDPGLVVTTVLADVDNLKSVNDSRGHHVGDELLRAAADLLRSAAPDGALVARTGGDEFAILVVHRVGEVSAAEIVERLRARQVPRTEPTGDGTDLSMSVGAATSPGAASVREAIAVADRRTMDDKRARKVGRLSQQG